MSPDIDLPRLQRLMRDGVACPHCGNVVLTRGMCPMSFPRPDCVADVEAMRAALRAILETSTFDDYPNTPEHKALETARQLLKELQ